MGYTVFFVLDHDHASTYAWWTRPQRGSIFCTRHLPLMLGGLDHSEVVYRVPGMYKVNWSIKFLEIFPFSFPFPFSFLSFVLFFF